MTLLLALVLGAAVGSLLASVRGAQVERHMITKYTRDQ